MLINFVSKIDENQCCNQLLQKLHQNCINYSSQNTFVSKFGFNDIFTF